MTILDRRVRVWDPESVQAQYRVRCHRYAAHEWDKRPLAVYSVTVTYMEKSPRPHRSRRRVTTRTTFLCPACLPPWAKAEMAMKAEAEA